MKNKAKSRKDNILNTIHATAKGLERIGLIDKRAMRKYDLLCLKKIPVEFNIESRFDSRI